MQVKTDKLGTLRVRIQEKRKEFWDEDNKTSVNKIDDLPNNFKDWIVDNQERMDRARAKGTLPYFVRDNLKKLNN